VIRFVPYGVFVRVFDDINGLVHLSELSQKSVNNPNEVVKIGQSVKVKLILLDPKNRKIGLSMKDLDETAEKAPTKKKTELADVAKKLEEEANEKTKEE
jgi:ribosomal protein S1